MRRALFCLALILLFGLARVPFERGITRDLHAAHFLEYQLNLDVRAQAGQMGFIAALSGYRAVVADYMWIEAYTAWSRTEWGRLKLLLDTTTALQPRAVTFWDLASWHMAWNAATNARENRKEPRLTLRLKAERDYILIGERYLIDGLKYNPDSAKLWESLGTLPLGENARPLPRGARLRHGGATSAACSRTSSAWRRTRSRNAPATSARRMKSCSGCITKARTSASRSCSRRSTGCKRSSACRRTSRSISPRTSSRRRHGSRLAVPRKKARRWRAARSYFQILLAFPRAGCRLNRPD